MGYVVTRSARKDARCLTPAARRRTLRALKPEGNRRHRREVARSLRLVSDGRLDAETATFEPSRLVTGWDVI